LSGFIRSLNAISSIGGKTRHIATPAPQVDYCLEQGWIEPLYLRVIDKTAVDANQRLMTRTPCPARDPERRRDYVGASVSPRIRFVFWCEPSVSVSRRLVVGGDGVDIRLVVALICFLQNFLDFRPGCRPHGAGVSIFRIGRWWSCSSRDANGSRTHKQLRDFFRTFVASSNFCRISFVFVRRRSLPRLTESPCFEGFCWSERRDLNSDPSPPDCALTGLRYAPKSRDYRGRSLSPQHHLAATSAPHSQIRNIQSAEFPADCPIRRNSLEAAFQRHLQFAARASRRLCDLTRIARRTVLLAVAVPVAFFSPPSAACSRHDRAVWSFSPSNSSTPGSRNSPIT